MLFHAVALAIAAQSAPAAPEVPASPQAAVQANRIAHPGEKVMVTVPASARHLGSERFNLYGVADAEVHLFVEPDADGGMRRLWWVQFESYLPSNDHRYDYADGNRPIELGGVRTWLLAGPRSTAGPTRPGSDREHVFGILQRAGIPIPTEVMNVRLVQILDDPAGTGQGRRELMIVYSEPLAPTGKALADLTTDGKPNDQWQAMEKALIERATGSVSITRN